MSAFLELLFWLVAIGVSVGLGACWATNWWAPMEDER